MTRTFVETESSIVRIRMRQDMDRALVVDADRCTGCELCVDLCSGTKTGHCSTTDSWIRVLRNEPAAVFIPVMCVQCQEHPCSEACPEEAIQYNPELSIYTVETKNCTACGICEDVCPYRGIFADGEVARKCDLCGGSPACVQVCNPKALQWVEISKEGLNDVLANRRDTIQKFEGIEHG